MHFDHCQENTGGAKNCLGWGHTRDLLGEVQGFDGDIQQSEGILLTFLSFGAFRIHGRRSWYLRENGVAHRLCRTLIWVGGHSMVSRLVQTEPFDERHCIRGRALVQTECDRPITSVPSFCNQHSLCSHPAIQEKHPTDRPLILGPQCSRIPLTGYTIS